MRAISKVIQSVSAWVFMGTGFAMGIRCGCLIFLFFSDTFSFLEGYRLELCIFGAGIGGAHGFTLFKWALMKWCKQVWQRLDWTANAIEIPLIICDLSVILVSIAFTAVLLKVLAYETIGSFDYSDQMMTGKIGAIIGAVIALGVILFKRIKKRSFMKADNH